MEFMNGGRKMKYKNIHNDMLSTLEINVNEHLKDGWQPIGGIVITTFIKKATIYSQSLIKYENENYLFNIDVDKGK